MRGLERVAAGSVAACIGLWVAWRGTQGYLTVAINGEDPAAWVAVMVLGGIAAAVGAVVAERGWRQHLRRRERRRGGTGRARG